MDLCNRNPVANPESGGILQRDMTNRNGIAMRIRWLLARLLQKKKKRRKPKLFYSREKTVEYVYDLELGTWDMKGKEERQDDTRNTIPVGRTFSRLSILRK